MINRQQLLSDLQKLLQKLEADLLERSMSAEVPEVGVRLKEEHERATKAQRTAQNYEDWRTDAITQAAAAWVLSCVFVRFLEDNRLIDPPKISGPASGGSGQLEGRLERARDEHELYFRQHPKQTDREYLLSIFDQLAKLPGTKDVFGEHNPIRELPNWLSGDAAGELLKFFQKIDANTGALVHDFTDANWDTRFLGDLYQDLSEAARKKYALLQTPEFVEEFILDRTLDPALDEFTLTPSPPSGAEGRGEGAATDSRFKMIDPACGSGHFLLGSFPRILDRWMKKEPGTNVRELVQRTLDSIHGVDVNPFAIAIARFRLLLAALKACNIQRLADAPAFQVNLVCGDSLLHVPLKSGGKKFTKGQREFDAMVTDSDSGGDVNHAYQSEDLQEVKRIVRPGQYHAVVANPPYITPKDRALNEQYRNRFESCHMKYSLSVPFMEQLFRLAIRSKENGAAGYTGQITANSFMKREFGKKLIESFFPTVDLTHVIDTSGAFIPGHGTPTVIVFGRHRPPVANTLRGVMGIRGEPSTPSDPALGCVWTAIVQQIDHPGSRSEFVSVGDSSRSLFHKHPWSVGGGGAAELKERLNATARITLDEIVTSIGPSSFTGIDEMFFAPRSVLSRQRVSRNLIRELCTGEQVRDWGVQDGECAFTPYGLDQELIEFEQDSGWARRQWSYRCCSEGMVSFGRQTRRELGEIWWSWYRWIPERYISPLSIVFGAVATHNHFVLVRGDKVFKQSAPVIKLPPTTTDADHFPLIGLLNSSTACFWMKQVMFAKSSQRAIGAHRDRPEEVHFDFASTALLSFPVPIELPSKNSSKLQEIVAEIDRLAARLHQVRPESIMNVITNIKTSTICKALDDGRNLHTSIHQRMIALQEELDWEVYEAFGLSSTGASEDILNDVTQGIPADARPFAWESETAPESVPPLWRDVYSSRHTCLQSQKELAIIETLVYKRPWWGRQGIYGRSARDYEGWTSEALVKWLLNRLESFFDLDQRMKESVPCLVFSVQQESQNTITENRKLKTENPPPLSEIQLVSVSRLASVAGQDADFLQVGELFRNDAAFDVQALVSELVATECAPLLPVLRYKPSGLIKRKAWERTWDLQRHEDAIDVRTKLSSNDPDYLTEGVATTLKQEQVGTISVPTKYDSKDFLDSNLWRLRGKLDVPKERWISFPHCEGPDGTPMLCWAGYDHLQQARAISAYYVQVQTEFGGTADPRLIPLLACLIELLPWLKQWHNDLDPEFNMSMGDYFEGFINEEARQLGKTIQEIREWTPPAKTVRKKRT